MKRLGFLCAPWLLCLAAAAAAAADSVPMRVAPVSKPIMVGGAQPGQTIVVKRFLHKPTDAKIGERQSGMFCGADAALRFSEALGSFVLRNAGATTRRELDAGGYPKIVESAFDGASGGSDVEYELAATMTDVQLYLCGLNEVKGSAWVELDWELYSPRERRVVYRTTKQGSFKSDKDMEIDAFIQQAVAANVRNLMGDPGFVEHATRRARLAAPSVQLPLLALASRATPGSRAQSRMPQLQSAVATVFSSSGNGSGFFVNAEQGYLLTSQHVVGDNKFVKIKLGGGRELLGEVVRLDAGRDVALIKTEAVQIVAAELASDDPKAGDEVYALGSPLTDQLAGTVTRGVLSSMRELEQRRWLQSDVSILPGSSGGPLVGSDGAVIGISTKGIAGINLFVPIRDALATLRIDFKSP